MVLYVKKAAVLTVVLVVIIKTAPAVLVLTGDWVTGVNFV